MSNIIRILPPDVASQIAAGEVVNRPSSVVKELLENAVDAGATQIKIVVVDAGRTSIQIIDNGAGMGSEDAVTAVQRHATSKIKESDDLYSLSTFGFRGEALASIAAVAQVELRTRRQEDETGTLVEAAASEIVNAETITCPAGSNFLVKNLFYNVPARRKFLKSNQTEFGHILTEVERVAIVRPDIALSLFHQGEEVLSLPVSSLKQRLVNLFGKKINQQLLPVDVQTSVLSITGFAGNLDSVRRKIQEQYFFVNGRYMKHPYFHKAVQSAYEGMIQEGFQAPYFLFFEVPADTIDVNIHPTKQDIKFSKLESLNDLLFNRYDNKPLFERVELIAEKLNNSYFKGLAKDKLSKLQAEAAQQQEQEKLAADKRSQVGTGDRSERIRTYNFPQGRVTDHRIGLTLYSIENFMNGDIGEMVEALRLADQTAKLQNSED